MILRLFYLKILFFINISLIFCSSVVYDKCGVGHGFWTVTKTKDGAENGWSAVNGRYTSSWNWPSHIDANGNKFYVTNDEFKRGKIFNNVSDEPYFISCEDTGDNLNEITNVEWTEGCVIDYTFNIKKSKRSIIFEKQGESCSEDFIEYEWNLKKQAWIKIQCTSDDGSLCTGNGSNVVIKKFGIYYNNIYIFLNK